MKINLKKVKPLIGQALKEDIGKGDITSELTVSAEACCLALVMAKQDGVLAGIDVCREVFLTVDQGLKAEVQKKDGVMVEFGQVVLTIQGNTRSILAAERTALNFLQHLSGIATITSKFVETVKGTNAKILDTRKTMPGLRQLEKYAVACGGGQNHRMGLYDMVLIKDNHIEAAGGVGLAVRKVKESDHGRLRIEVEVQNLSQLAEAVAGEADVVMLDNMGPEQMAEACRAIMDAPAREQGKLRLEASGNVSLENVREVAECGVDFISIGAITHSAPALEFSMKLKAVG